MLAPDIVSVELNFGFGKSVEYCFVFMRVLRDEMICAILYLNVKSLFGFQR